MLYRTLRRMILTNGEIYSDKVYLGVNDSPENWHEIPGIGTIV